MIWILTTLCLMTISAVDSSGGVDGPLYPYGVGAGDQKLETDDNLPVFLGYQTNFYGRKYNTAYLTKNGFVGFDRNIKYEHFIYDQAVQDVTLDFPFVAPFYFGGEQITAHYQGNIFYRLVFTNTSRDFLLELKEYMLHATSGSEGFEPDLALVVTWDSVTDKSQVENAADNCRGTQLNPCKSATFQLVLVACPVQTFVIFNYKKMDIPPKHFYQAGINGGHGVGWTSVCDGCDLSTLPAMPGSDVKGRFIFKVSKDVVQRGGCGDSGNYLQIIPNVVSMFGGEMLDVTGPCLKSNAIIKCQFGSDQYMVTSDGVVVNSMRFRCPVPRLTERGYVTLAVSLDGGLRDPSRGQIYIVMDDRLPKSLQLSVEWYKSTTPESLSMTWNPSALTQHTNAKVDINLIGYSEKKMDETRWVKLASLAADYDNSGSFSFHPSQFQCQDEECELYEVGIVEIQLQKRFYTSESRVAMKAGVIPLGWYMNTKMSEKYGEKWAPKKCMEWYDKDKQGMPWLDNLLHCPCTVAQALVDFGRWQTDSGCNMFSKSKGNCYFHGGAQHCVRSFWPSIDGAGNQCCYGENGLLIYAADTYQGSTPDRSHAWGATPYNQVGRVPDLSHWIDDVVTFYYCCLWTEYDHCDYYMDQRATRDCKQYQPSQAAIAYGDPHISTFDGQLYNFGGKGDFYLIKSDEFSLQGKFELANQVHADDFRFNATMLTAVAVGDVVEIRLAPTGLDKGRQLDVFVNKKLILFDDPALFKQDFADGVSIINVATDGDNNRHDNFTVLLRSGVGVQVAASNGLLHVIANLPPRFKNKSRGLMGTWSGSVDDDYTSKNGESVDINSSPETVYQRFAKSWMVPNVESKFIYKTDGDDQFVPQYSSPQIPSGSGFSRMDVTETCGDNRQCQYDYIVTGDRTVAEASKKIGEWFAVIKQSQTPVESCGLLDVPRAEKSGNDYSLGNTITITGCRNGGELSGELTYECTKSTTGRLYWKPDVTAVCSSDTGDKAQLGMIIGIVAAAVVAIIVVIIVIVVVIRRRKGSKNSKRQKQQTDHGETDKMMSDLKKRVSREHVDEDA